MECAGATPPSELLARPACVLSMAVAFGRRDNPFRLDGACQSTALTHIPIAFSSDRISPMPIFKYFLYVGSLLSLLLFAWCVYLEPPPSEAQGSPPSAGIPEVFRPTPAPPIVEAEQLPVEETLEPTTSSARSRHVAKVAQQST